MTSTTLGSPAFFRTGACRVGDRWVRPRRPLIDVDNPATEKRLGTVPDAPASLVHEAIDAAGAALPGWAATPAPIRARILRTIAAGIESDLDTLARIMTLEQGKPLAESRAELEYAAGFFTWFAGEAERVGGRTIPASTADRRLLTIRKPVGVCAAITPWNFPAAMLARKLAPALAAGCTMVAKPDHQTPFSAIALGHLCERAGLPAGVFNIVTGDAKRIARAFMEREDVRKVTFTGSTEIGKLLMRQSADTLKRITMELGGNAPFIVFADADLDAAVRGAMQSKYRNSGQTCVCANRFLVERSIIGDFSAALARASARLRCGDGLKQGTTLGPLINDDAVKKVLRLVRDAMAHGAKVASASDVSRTGARASAPLPPEYRRGSTRFLPPLVLTGVTADMAIAHEEIFGPVCAIQVFDTEAEAIGLANGTPYGLASYVYTSSFNRTIRLAESLDCGIVGVNTGLISTPQAPFGGVKQSGFGREGGHEGIDAYLETTYICLGGLEPEGPRS